MEEQTELEKNVSYRRRHHEKWRVRLGRSSLEGLVLGRKPAESLSRAHLPRLSVLCPILGAESPRAGETSQQTGGLRNSSRSLPKLLFKEKCIRHKRAAPLLPPKYLVPSKHEVGRWGGTGRHPAFKTMWWQAHFRPRLILYTHV